MQDRYRIIPAAHLLLIRDQSILLARRFNTGYEDGNYSVAAGHLDGGESVRAAMVREAKEELGIDIDPSDLRIVHVMHRNSDDERVDFFLTTDVWQGEPRITEQDKCDDIRWFPLNGLPNNTIPYVRSAIESVKANESFSEFGW